MNVLRISIFFFRNLNFRNIVCIYAGSLLLSRNKVVGREKDNKKNTVRYFGRLDLRERDFTLNDETNSKLDVFNKFQKKNEFQYYCVYLRGFSASL